MKNKNYSFAQYNNKIIEKINEAMIKANINQKKLSNETDISQSTLSKLLSNKSKFTIEQLVKICLALEINISNLVSFNNLGITFTDNVYSTNYIADSDNLVCDIRRPAFKGYVGNKYFIYFYSTVDSENKIINGTFELYASEDKRCKINLEIYTGQIDVLGQKITKKYTGDMIISIPLSSCYCILLNKEIGEMCFLNFHHMFLLSQNMLCRVGTVLTTSSGENRRPTIHRIVLSKYPYDIENNSEDLMFIKGQLKLNDSKITVSKEKFEKLLEEMKTTNLTDIIEFLNKFKNLSLEKTYYCIDENKLLDSSIEIMTKVNGISLLREASTSNKYNKINSVPDEFLFQYIVHKKLNKS